MRNGKLLLLFNVIFRFRGYRPDHHLLGQPRPFAKAKSALTATFSDIHWLSVRPCPLTFGLIMGYNS